MNESGKKLKDYLILITYAIFLYLAVSNIGRIRAFLGKVLIVLMPFILGVLFAYVLNILMSLLEREFFNKLDKSKKPFFRKLKRPLSILTTFVLVIAFITGVLLYVVPQISQSISTLAANIPSYLETLENYVNHVEADLKLSGKFWNNISFNWNEIISKVSGFISTAFPRILTFTLGLTNKIIHFVMSLIIAVYLLANKEKLIRLLKKLIYAFTPGKIANRIIDTGAQINSTFQNFISGQLTEALILGILVFTGMLIFKFPYAVLCAVIIAITNIIPIFGPWIGMIPCSFIILMTAPSKIFWFLLFILVLQQIENNLIYPKVVGNSIGLDGLWVLFAIIVGGSLFGVVGMLLGIPAFAVLYTIIRRITNRRLSEKNIVIR